jgi:Family of unknown function (DUF6023)
MADPTHRLTGAALYAGAAVPVAAGALWWVAAAPEQVADTKVVAWRRTVEQILPERADQVDARTHVLNPGEDIDDQGDVQPGPHVLTLVCAGRGQVRVRLGPGVDSGWAVPCADTPALTTLPSALGTNPPSGSRRNPRGAP